MTLYETLSLIVSIISSITILVSLVLVYRQTRIFARQTDYVARSLTDDVKQYLNAQSHEIGRIFIEYPELRPYFYEGKPVTPEHPDYQRVEAIAEVILDIFWTMAEQTRGAAISPEKAAGARMWYSYVNDCFTNGPILVEVLKKRESWYGLDILNKARSYAKLT